MEGATQQAAAAAEKQVDVLAGAAKNLLVGLIRFKSLGGMEDEAQQFLKDWMVAKGLQADFEQADPGLESDPNYTHHSLDGHHAPNIIVRLPHAGGGRSLLLNSHVDVVPAENPEMYSPKVEGDTITGRGAADAKGMVVGWLLAMLAVKEAGVKLAGECTGTAVVEEEVGGNGTLAWIRNHPETPDAAVVMEATEQEICPANRGAVWFKITVEGIPTHMGSWWKGQSAFENLEKILAAVRVWDAKLVAESRGVPLFPDDPSPVHVNVGMVRAGDWPSKVPATAEAEGGVGFLPNKSLESVKDEMREVVRKAAEENGIKATVVFEKLANDAYATPADHPAVIMLADAAEKVMGSSKVSAFLASCDARLLYHRSKMPTIVYGPGSLLMAHADVESIEMAEIVKAAKTLARFIVEWCGVANA